MSSQPEWYDVFVTRHELSKDVSPSIPSEIFTSTRARLEEDHKFLTQALLAVRSRLNALTPIHRLPPEILAKIFSHIGSFHRPSPPRLGWIAVTHVCRHWRHAALAHPSLWAEDVCSPLHWTARNLERSKQYPINIRVREYVDTQSPPKALRLALREIGRARRIEMLIHNVWIGALEDELTQPAPLLEYLAVDTEFMDGPRAPGFPEDLFQRHAPRLSTIFFTGIAPPVTPWLYANITEAVIQRNHFMKSLFATDDDFLDVLEGMPKVRKLVLRSAIVYANPLNDRTVHLPCLRSLCITHKLVDNLWILQRLAIPNIQNLQTTFDVRNDELIPSLAPFIPLAANPDQTPRRPRTLGITVDLDVVVIAAWDNTLPKGESCLRSDSAIFDICFETSGVLSSARNLMNQLPVWLEELSADEISAVRVFCGPGQVCSPAPLFDALRFLPSVETVFINTASTAAPIMDVFVDAIRSSTPSHTEHPIGVSRSRLLPCLRHIRFVGVDFTYHAPDPHPDVGGSSLADHQKPSTLIQFIRSHSEYGGIEHVDLRSCIIPAAGVNELRKLVPMVEWDGVEEGFERAFADDIDDSADVDE
ncbi:hypothetical protein OF83DRAFT_1265503 [Amylostereum chailletii]|nr:hypothetical protein OF83DRAFT_1265503 [Amylostereum chailletii]